MKNKRGVSAVLATVLIILQIVVAITVIWTFVYGIIKVSDGELSFSMKVSQYEIKQVKLWITGGASIQFKCNSIDEEMDSIKVIFYDKNGDGHDIVISDPDRIPGLHETQTIVLTIDEVPINSSEIESISIFPTDGKNYGLESEEPESFIKKDSSDNRILDAPPEAISWWMFDKTAKDSFGNNHGELMGDATITKDGELYLDGYEDYLDIGHHDNLDIRDNDWTISLWVKPERLSGLQYLLAKSDVSSFANGQYAILLSEDTFRAYLFDTFPKTVTGQESLETDQWIYLTAVYKKADGLKTYVNGNFDMEVSISSSSYETLEDTPLQIGCIRQTMCFQGLIDDVVIFNKALSESEIKAIYNNQQKS